MVLEARAPHAPDVSGGGDVGKGVAVDEEYVGACSRSDGARSISPKWWAGRQVAARSASTGVSPASTSSSSSWCTLDPWGTDAGAPGAESSVQIGEWEMDPAGKEGFDHAGLNQQVLDETVRPL
ncbi:MAG: hypothetical protein ACRDO8_12915 [Nocardioidaceae bacterium]